MYTCMSAVCLYACIYVCLYVSIHASLFVCMYVWIRAYMYIYVRIYACINLSIYLPIYRYHFRFQYVNILHTSNLLSICFSTNISTFLFICLYLSPCIPIYLSILLPVYPVYRSIGVHYLRAPPSLSHHPSIPFRKYPKWAPREPEPQPAHNPRRRTLFLKYH